MIIVLEGTHCVGKTTLAQQISKSVGAPIFKQNDAFFLTLAEMAKKNPAYLGALFTLQNEFMDSVREKAKDHEIVVVDRWLPTTVVKQSLMSKRHMEICQTLWQESLANASDIKLVLMLGLVSHIHRRLIERKNGVPVSKDSIDTEQDEYRNLIPHMDFVYYENVKKATVSDLIKALETSENKTLTMQRRPKPRSRK